MPDFKAALRALATACVKFSNGAIDQDEWEHAVCDALIYFSEVPTEDDMKWAKGVAEKIGLGEAHK